MSSRRGVGLSAFQNRTNLSTSYASHGAALRSTHLSSLQTQLSVFQSLLHTFALQHGDKIKKEPQFRAEFARMCNVIGVDPLAASNVNAGGGAKSGAGKGGWWSQILGEDAGDFYYGLAVRVVEVCQLTRGENGGLLGIEECRARIRKGRAIGSGMEVSEYVATIEMSRILSQIMSSETIILPTVYFSFSDDILRAVKSLEPLGSGFSVIKVGSKQMIRSVPKELNIDQSTVLEVIQVLGYVTVSMLEDNLNWEAARAQTVIEDLLADSLVWVDAKTREKEYWSPAFIKDLDE
ncbi:hypothetical protein MMC25_000291 [Agyrium rufum]|nr:hypothetical protein [Agyrium rufum]